MADTSFTAYQTTILSTWLNQVNLAAFQGRSPNAGTTTGAANAQVLTLATGSLYVAQQNGDTFGFIAGYTNSGAATLQIVAPGGALAAAPLQMNGAALTGGEVIAGQPYVVAWATDAWELVSLAGTVFGTALLQAADATAVRILLSLGALALLNTVGTAQIDNSAVTTAKLNDEAVTVAKLDAGAASGVKNYIINGGCQIAQTGSVTVTPADNVFIVGGTDMAASACTNRTSMAVNNAANTGMVTGYAHQITLTSSAAGVVNGAFRIEAKDAVALNGKQVTFACKGYQNSGGSLQARLRLRKPSAADDFTTLTTISTGSDFAVADSTVVPSSLTVTLGASDASNGLQVEIEYTTGAAVTGKVFQIGDAQLVEGSTAPAFVADAVEVTLAKCQRYYEKSYSTDVAPAANSIFGLRYIGGQPTPTGYGVGTVAFSVSKRVSPTITIYSRAGTSGTVSDGDQNDYAAGAGNFVSTTSFALQNTSGSNYSSTGGVVCFHYVADARLK